MSDYCYLSKKYLKLNQTKIAVTDIGVLRGYGVFDFLRTYNKKPFLLDEHLKRFKNSARILGLKLPATKVQLTKIIFQLLKKCPRPEANIRMVLTGGQTINGLDYDYEKPTLFIYTDKCSYLPEKIYRQGAKLITDEFSREFSKAKTLNYIRAVYLQKIKKQKGALEILYTHDNKIFEGTTSNFFIFRDNKLITPKDGVLLGITRNLVIKLAKPKFKIVEREIKINELKLCDEAFITASNKEIVPIVKINNLKISNGKVGKRTAWLMNAYKNYTTNH